MKNPTHLLSLKLYKEGLRQLRFKGLLGGGLILAIPLVALVMTITVAQGKQAPLAQSASDATTTASFWLFAAIVAVFLLSLLFTYSLFSFLNKRDGSDFYHALSAPRQTLYLSFSAAVLTWTWGIGLAAIALTVAGRLITGAPLAPATVLLSVGLFLSASLFVVAVALLALSITGTLFSNLSVSILVMLTPYLVARYFTQAVVKLVPNIPDGFVGLAGGASLHNTFFLLLEQLLLPDRSVHGLTSVLASIVATFVWALVLIGAGAWFFKCRASESAGTGVPAKGLRLVYWVVLGICVVFLALNVPVGAHNSEIVVSADGSLSLVRGSLSGVSIAPLLRSLVVPFALALVVVLIFELFTARRLRRLLLALPSFGLVLAFTAAFFGLVFLYSSYEGRFAPAADQIASVRLLSSMDGAGLAGLMPENMFSPLNQGSYNQLLLQRVTIKDPALLQATADKLREPFVGGSITDTSAQMLVEIHTKSGRSAYRLIDVRLGLKPDEFNRALYDVPEVMDALLALPKPDASLQVSSNMFVLSTNFLTSSGGTPEQKRASHELYALFYADYQALNPAQQYQVLYGPNTKDQLKTSSETTIVADFTQGGSIQVEGVFAAHSYCNYYTVLTPKASEFYWKMTCSDLLENLDQKSPQVRLCQISLYAPQNLRNSLSAAEGASEDTAQGSSSDSFWLLMSKKYASMSEPGGSGVNLISETEMQKTVTPIIRPALSRDFDIDAPCFAVLTYGVYSGTEATGIGLSAADITIPLTTQEAAALQALTQE
ncbi:MAG: hypothetical protein FWC54_04390 [Actinomycetia bacterium]|nr:hypothetical protein [Actinomycetes bacterium]